MMNEFESNFSHNRLKSAAQIIVEISGLVVDDSKLYPGEQTAAISSYLDGWVDDWYNKDSR